MLLQARAWTLKEFLDGFLEVLGLKEISPEKDYVMDVDLEILVKDCTDDLFCPISHEPDETSRIHPRTCLRVRRRSRKLILQNGRDIYNMPSTVKELQEVPKLKALIDELVEEFGIRMM